ncbi:MAG TPA: PadR family transcriptional regulator [Bryobacteraceae bacterium]|nr:PadR family transcriptional regulator [Bryobacteraceae bacterium]
MPKHTHESLQGNIDLLVLKALARQGAMHGYGITTYIQQVSKDCLRIEEGSLYPALHRMAQQGWIASEWGLSENNRRARYYAITEKGQQQLALQEKRCGELAAAVSQFLRFA